MTKDELIAKGFVEQPGGNWVKLSTVPDFHHIEISKQDAEFLPASAFPMRSNRIRQNPKPLMNKLETEFLETQLKTMYSTPISIQAITFRLANGLRYTPDFVSLSDLKAWEVKGAWVDGDSFPKLKMAAAVYPEIVWLLVWKKNGVWRGQRVLP